MQIKTKLYKGEVELLFESFRHTYTVFDEKNGVINERRPSATTALSIIAKPQLIYWAANITADTIKGQLQAGVSLDELQIEAIIETGRKAHTNRKREAGTIGSFVHKWVEDYIKGKNPTQPVNKDLAEAIAKFMGWVEKHQVKFLLSEQQVYSRKYGFTGTLDFICLIDGKMYVGDLKTSSGIYPEMLIQTSAYRFARTEEFPEEEYEGQIIVRIGQEDGALEIGMVTDPAWYKKMLAAFLYSLELYKGMEGLKEFKVERLHLKE